MSDRRLYPESKLPMTTRERELFLEAYEKTRKKYADKRSDADIARLAHSNAVRAVRRSRGRMLSAEERTLDLFARAS